MKTDFLFPNRFKVISGFIFITSFILLIAYIISSNYEMENLLQIHSKAFAVVGEADFFEGTRYFEWIETIITDELLILVIILSGIIYAFSKEKHEDEFVTSIRLHSLAWSTILNYSILLFCYLFIYGLPFFNILLAAMFSQLLIFIVLFRIRMHIFNRSVYEEHN